MIFDYLELKPAVLQGQNHTSAVQKLFIMSFVWII